MGGSETTGTQVGRALPHAHEVYTGVDVGALSSTSCGGGSGSGGVISNREDDREKQESGQGERVMIPRSVTNLNGMGERVRILQGG